jgi:23S rRNA U2552 (ribose-2'-O)-methylase RlmE/FtsJ
MLNFLLPRLNINFYEEMNMEAFPNLDKYIQITGTRNIYIDNIDEQINLFKGNWEILLQIYYPYEFISYTIQITLRHAMHIEIQHFIKNSMLIKCNRILHSTMTRSLNFCGCDVNQNYLQHDNIHTNIEYNAKNIDQILSENLSTIDHITIGTYSHDNYNEDEYARILYVCVLYALCFQKHKGNAIVKVFNIDTSLSIGIIALLSSMYQEVQLIKPLMSYTYSSEVFIVCKNFLPNNSKPFFRLFMSIIQYLPKINYSHEVFKIDIINLLFYNRINEIAVIFYQRRLEFLHSVLNSTISSTLKKSLQPQSCKIRTLSNERDAIQAEKSRIVTIIRSNIQKCLHWSSQHDIIKQVQLNSDMNTMIDSIVATII